MPKNERTIGYSLEDLKNLGGYGPRDNEEEKENNQEQQESNNEELKSVPENEVDVELNIDKENDQVEDEQNVEVPQTTEHDAEKYFADVEEASEILGDGAEEIKEEPTPENLHRQMQEFRNNIEIPEPQDEQEYSSEIERQIEKETDNYISQMAEESERRALQRVRNRKQVRDLVKSYEDLKQTAVHLLAQSAIQMPYKRTQNDDGLTYVENIVFEEGKDYYANTVIMGLIHATSEVNRVYNQNRSLNQTLETYKDRISELSNVREEQNEQLRQLKDKVRELKPIAEEFRDYPVEKLAAEHGSQYLIYNPNEQTFLGRSDDADEDTEPVELEAQDFESVGRIGPAMKFDTKEEAEEVISMLRQMDKRWRNKLKKIKKKGRKPSKEERKKYKYHGPQDIKNYKTYRVVLQLQ